MPKSLIVFSDGTNQKGGVTHDSNVWRLYRMIERSSGDQLTFYDDGVGTQDFAPMRLISGAFGFGLSRNIRQAYTFLVKNYQPGDSIYLFGFSRGAFTVRSLLGFINRCGLVDLQERARDEEKPVSQQLASRVREAFRAYRSIREGPAARERERNLQPNVAFIGVWDTVDAVGMPVDELRPVVDWVPRLLLGRRGYDFRDRKVAGVSVARQALSIDDERRTFHPNVWEGAGVDGNGDPVDVEQVWFSGVHANVGGSYPKDGLAYVTLEWMIGELLKTSREPGTIRLRPSAVEEVNDLANHADKLYDSRRGLACYYRYSPRQLDRMVMGEAGLFRRFAARLSGKGKGEPAGVRVHISVLERIRQAIGDYAPLFIRAPAGPDGVSVVFTDLDQSLYRQEEYSGHALPFPELPAPVTGRLKRLVFYRQAWFYLFLVLSAAAAVAGLAITPPCEFGGTPPNRLAESLGPVSCVPLEEADLVNWTAGVLKSMLPALLERVVDNAYSYPWASVPLGGLLVLGYGMTKVFRRRIRDIARAGYDSLL